MSLGSSESDIRPSEPARTGQRRLLQEGGVGNAERAWPSGTCSKRLPPMTLMTPQVNCQGIFRETDLRICREAALRGTAVEGEAEGVWAFGGIPGSAETPGNYGGYRSPGWGHKLPSSGKDGCFGSGFCLLERARLPWNFAPLPF